MKQRMLPVVLVSLIGVLVSGFVFQEAVVGQNGQTTSEKSTDGPTLEEIEEGQRIRVQLKNGYQVKGNLVAKLKHQFRLDMSNEEQALSGTVTLDREDISSIARLEPVDPSEEEKAASTEKKQKTNQKQEKSTEKSNQSTDQKSEEEKTKSKKQKKEADQKETKNNEETKDGKEWPPKLTAEQQRLLNEFPQEEWNQSRYQELSNKYEFQLNTKKKAFLKNWKKIQEARKVQEKKKKYDLLQKFHPEDGWGPERYRHIKEDLAGLESKGVSVRSSEQREFLNVYSEWKKAYEMYKERQKKQQEEKKGNQK